MGTKYPGITVSGFNASPPSDAGAQTDENKVKWSTHKTKLGDPLNTAIAAIDTALQAAFDQTAVAKTTTYTTVLTDNAKLMECTGTFTLSLIGASTGGAGYEVNVLNVGTGVITVGRATGADTINGTAQNWTLNPTQGATFRVNAATNGYDVVQSYSPDYNIPTASGGPTAYTLTVAPALGAYYSGLVIRFINSATVNTGASTLAVNGLAATSIVKDGNVALAAGDLPASALIEVVYSGSSFRLNRTSGTSLTDVVHTTGTETIAGVKTLSNVLKITKVDPAIEFRNTTFGLPSGLWQIASGIIGNALAFLRNTAAAGDFSTFTTPLKFDSADAATFVGTVTAAAATVSTELVTKAQLDAKVYGGRITNNGTASVAYGPSGWTVSRAGAGDTTVTHNLGTTNYSVVGSNANIALGACTVTTIAANSVRFVTQNNSSVNTDTDYNFVLARN